MINTNNLDALLDSTVIDQQGDKIGTVGQVYVDTDSGAPTWASVRTGLFGMSESFVPIDQAEQTGDEIRVPFAKDFVKDAPRIDVDGALEESQEDELYAYYGNGTAGVAGGARTTDTDTTVGHDTSVPTTDEDSTWQALLLR